MNNDISLSTRRILIHIGKCLPFVLCAILFITYAEKLFACILSNFIAYGGVVIPNAPLSLLIGHLFEYDALTIACATILSLAIQVCKWNFLALLYLVINLLEKSFFDVELELHEIYTIIFINMVISGFLCYKGIKILRIK